jgi:hypothetical protein
MLETRQDREVGNNARAALGQGHAAIVGRRGEVQFGIGLAERRANWRKLVQQAAFELPRLDLVLFARDLIDNRYANPAVANAVAQLRGEIPLYFFAAQAADPIEQTGAAWWSHRCAWRRT